MTLAGFLLPEIFSNRKIMNTIFRFLGLLSTITVWLYSTNSFADVTGTCPTTTTLTLNGSITDGINFAGDKDTFRITVPSKGILIIYTTGATDTFGILKNSSCQNLVTNDDGKGNNFQISRAVTAGTYYITVRHYTFTGTGTYGIHNTFTATSGSSDAIGNTCSTAASLATNGSTSSAINSAGDHDYFRITLSNNSNLTVQTTGSIDTYGYLKDSNCNTIGSNDDDAANSNFLIIQSLNAGTYYVAVRHYNSTATGNYTLSNTVTPMATQNLAALATANNNDTNAINPILVTHNTDPLTAQTECPHTHMVTGEIRACDTWNTNLFSEHFGKCTHTYVVTPATYTCDTLASYKKARIQAISATPRK
jgi:hypothetical protein